MIALFGIVTVLLEYIDRLTPIMLALCLMLLVTYYAFNYAGIISRGLVSASNFHLAIQRSFIFCLKWHNCLHADNEEEDNPGGLNTMVLPCTLSETC